MGDVARGSGKRGELTPSSMGCNFVAEILGMVGEQDGGRDARSAHVRDDVIGKLGREESLQRGKSRGDCGHTQGDGDAWKDCFRATGGAGSIPTRSQP